MTPSPIMSLMFSFIRHLHYLDALLPTSDVLVCLRRGRDRLYVVIAERRRKARLLAGKCYCESFWRSIWSKSAVSYYSILKEGRIVSILVIRTISLIRYHGMGGRCLGQRCLDNQCCIVVRNRWHNVVLHSWFSFTVHVLSLSYCPVCLL